MAENSTSENQLPVENSTAEPASTSEPLSPAPSAESKIVETPRANAPAFVSVKNPVREKLVRATGATLEKFGFKKGRGRPKKCRSCDGACCEACNFTGFEPSISDKPATAVADATPVAVTVDDSPAVDPAFVAAAGTPAAAVPDYSAEVNQLLNRIFSNCAKGSVEGAKNGLRILSGAAGNEKDFTEKTLEKINPATDAVEDFADSVRLALKKRQPKLAGENGDLVAVGISGVRVFGPMAFIAWQLVKEARRRNKALEAKK